MTFTWRVLNIATGKIDDVEAYESLTDAVWDMCNMSWEDPSNAGLSFVESDGQVVATGLFGPDKELLVVLGDGRRFRFEEPESYKGDEIGTDGQPIQEAIRACQGSG